MLSFRIVLCLAACAISQAQNINFNNTYGFTAGKRLDGRKRIFIPTVNKFFNFRLTGDEFLYIGYQISPFFQERSNFSFSFEYNGDEKVANITRIEVKVENVSLSYQDSKERDHSEFFYFRLQVWELRFKEEASEHPRIRLTSRWRIFSSLKAWWRFLASNGLKQINFLQTN